MLPSSRPILAIVCSLSLLLQLCLVVEVRTVSGAARRWRSMDFDSVPPCRCCQSSSKYQYSVVVDAGSSGSRVHVYRWPQNTAGHVESTPGAVQALGPTLKVRVALETVARDPRLVRHHVERLLLNASRIVPQQLHQYTPVYFMATAGMREMLQRSMDELMTYIDSVMSDSDVNPFLYDSSTGVRVLSGEEEAIFDWISVNYLLGNFAEADKSLVGVVEMGGASVQIAFVPDSDITEHLFPVYVNNRRYLLFARSFLGYGQTSVIDHIKMQLEAQDPASEVIYHPCMLRGDVQLTAGRKTFVGTGNAQSCLDLLKKHVVCKGNESPCHPGSCAMGAMTKVSPPSDMQFYGAGAFLYTLPVVGALSEHAVFTPDVGYRKAIEFCELSYEQALVMVSEPERKYVTDRCLAALYIPLLLNYGLGFSNDSTAIHVPGNIAGQKPGWTLGAVLYENSQIEHDCQLAAAAGADDDDARD